MLNGIKKRSGQIGALYSAILYKIQEVGFLGFLRFCAGKLGARFGRRQASSPNNAFDREFGTDTAGLVPLWKLSVEGPHRQQGHRYEASDPNTVREAIENLSIEPENFAFVDIGSGKGLTLLVASEYPFRRIIGVEFSPELDAIAAENIRKYRSPKRKCSDVSSVCADATNYEFPAENTLFYLYNPFSEDVLQRMLENLKASLMRNKREIYLAYINIKPGPAELLDRTDFLQRIEVPIKSHAKTAVYKNRLAG